MFFLKLIVKNAFRHRLRTLLTILGIIIALVAFGLLRTVINAWYAGVKASSATRLVTRNAISLIVPLPISYKEKIRHVDGVEAVSYGSWFGGIYIDEKHFFANFAVDPESYLHLYPEIVVPPDQKEAFLRDRKACMAGRKLVEKYAWKIGDTITLKGTIYPGNWDFVLRAVYYGRDDTVDEATFLFHWDYLNEVVKKRKSIMADTVGFYMVGVKRPELAATVSMEIDAMFKNSLSETLTETEKAFNLGFISMTEAILVAIQLVSFVVILIIMAVVANTMSMTVRERIGEYAIMKALGFGWLRIGGLILGESLTITSIGCVLGIVLTYPAANTFAKKMGTLFPVFNIEPVIFIYYGAACLLIGVVAAIIPARRAIKLPIADGLRKIG
jgi:putative ABC transport system permease protein